MPGNEPESIAVTGATGLLGSYLVDAALAGTPGLRAMLLVRKPGDAHADTALGRLTRKYGQRIRLLAGSLEAAVRAPASHEPLFTASQGLWHCAANTQLGPETSPGALRRINVEATCRLLECHRAYAARTGVSPFYHVSTAYVAGCREGRVREDELDTGQAFHNAYEQSKADAEAAVRATAGLPAVIYRPSLVVSPLPGRGRPQVPDLFARAVVLALRLGEELVLRYPPEAAINLVDAAWVARVMWRLRSAAAVPPPVFHLTADHALTLGEILAAGARHTPSFRHRFEPGCPPDRLPPVSRRLDQTLGKLSGYLHQDIHFDKDNLRAHLPPGLHDGPPGLDAVAAARLEAVQRDFLKAPPR